MKIDSHQHLWRFDPIEYGWIADEATALRRDYLWQDLARELDASAIDAAVAVQARQSLAENDFLLDQADASRGRIRGVVGWVDLAADDVDGTLARYASRPRFVGVRPVVQSEPDPDFLARPAFNRGVAKLRAHGLVYDIHDGLLKSLVFEVDGQDKATALESERPVIRQEDARIAR